MAVPSSRKKFKTQAQHPRDSYQTLNSYYCLKEATQRNKRVIKRLKMETTQQQQLLVNMGFSQVLAAEALKASGGDILKATDWILSPRRRQMSVNPPPHPPPCSSDSSCTPTGTTTRGTLATQSPLLSSSDSDVNTSNNNNNNDIVGGTTTPPPPPPPPPPPSSNNFQPKLDRFFQFPHAITREKREHNHNHSPQNKQDLNFNCNTEPSSEFPFQPPPRKRPRGREEEEEQQQQHVPPSQPLSERMRPQSLDQVLGQDHILGPNSALRSAIHLSRLPSMVLWGPPGTGKTSIARAIVLNSSTSSPSDAAPAIIYRFVLLSAVNSGVKDVRDVVDEARNWTKKRRTMRTVLFIDEVHRFNKAQQDSLLPVIEDGSVVFVGATTENPSFHLITPLLSRCTLLILNPLQPHHIITLLKRAVSDPNKGIEIGLKKKIQVEDEAIEFLSAHCDGDARVALNALEISATAAAAACSRFHREGGQGSDSNNVSITLSHVKEALQCKHIAYDRAGDEHYNLISALHKSMRGSDSDASIYWLARMLEGGEQPLYIARRLIRFASEDVGLADPSALTQAVACYQACHFIGMPECNVNLAQCVSYLALAPKSISVYRAIEDAQKVVRESVGLNEGVPLHLRNAPTKLMKDIGYGKDYVYPPDHKPNSFSQTYMPPSLQGHKFLYWPNDVSRSD